jgi:hypothetical protein
VALWRAAPSPVRIQRLSARRGPLGRLLVLGLLIGLGRVGIDLMNCLDRDFGRAP